MAGSWVSLEEWANSLEIPEVTAAEVRARELADEQQAIWESQEG